TDDIQYADRVRAEVHIISDDIESFCRDITQMTDGKAVLERGPAEYFRKRTDAGD
ncbi:MAG: DUF1949 domain-containing protein, partial [Lachnospiraceae bacterium]|nr:DUF1949 domain-containing protein [Lachnospiraceae bacterium]